MASRGSTPRQLEARRANLRRARELDGAQILASLGPDDGLVSYQSSPHVMWLADQLSRVCWLPPAAPAS